MLPLMPRETTTNHSTEHGELKAAATPGPLGTGLGGLAARLLAPIYAKIIARKNAAFDAGHGVVELDRPVVSVGNLSVGGTGKTPMVLHLVDALRRADHLPVVAMRGYARGGRLGGAHSDEASAYRRAFPELAIVARPDRTQGLIELFSTDAGVQVDCVVLDDGFQHRQIARQFNIVLVDATRSPFDDDLLPAGWLREPVTSLRRADAIVVTHSELATPVMLRKLDADIAAITGSRPMAICRHEWAELSVFDAGNQPAVSVSELQGRRILAACAIGNPGAFIASCDQAVGSRGHVQTFIRPDHDAFAPATVRSLIMRARECAVEFIVVTDKDWSKLMRAPADDWPCPILRPRLKLRFERGEAELTALMLRTIAQTQMRFAQADPDDRDPGPNEE